MLLGIIKRATRPYRYYLARLGDAKSPSAVRSRNRPNSRALPSMTTLDDGNRERVGGSQTDLLWYREKGGADGQCHTSYICEATA